MPPTSLLYPRAASNVCNTADCHAASTFVKQYVKLNVDPCSDFFEYSCGAWIDVVEAKDVSRESVTDVTANNIVALVGILESSYDDFMAKHLKTNTEGFNVVEQAETDRANFQKAKDFYNVCLVPGRNVAELYPEIAYIKHTLLPATPGTISKQIARTLAYFTRQSISSILNAFVFINTEDHDYKMAYFDTPDLDPESDQDIELVVTAALGLDNQTRHVLDASHKSNIQLWSRREIKTAVTSYSNIQSQLSKLKETSPVLDLDNLPPNTNLGTLMASSNGIDWSSYFSDLVDPGYASNPATPLQYSQKYIQSLEKLLASLTLQELQDFFVVRFVMNRYANNLFQIEVPNEFEKTPLNITVRQSNCAERVGKVLYNNIGRFFALETIGGINEKNDIDRFVNELQTSWLNHLPGTPWLDANTKARAIEKINTLKPRTVMNMINPDWTNPRSIQSYYEHLSVDKTSYYKSESNFLTWNGNRQWKNIPNRVLKVEWSSEGSSEGSASNVNAFYAPQWNQFELPIGIIQKIFYDSKFPQYLNYGGLGSVIGHELTHALDNGGRLYNSTGYKEDWWSPESVKQFNTRSQCFVEQYNKTSIVNKSTGEKIFINGEISLGENIADSGGLSIALLAYREHFKKLEQQELSLPDFEHLSAEQMFFVGYAIPRCHAFDKSLTGFDPNEVHPPWSVRTTNSLINSADFAKAFNCPVGSPMNPHKSDQDRCVIW